MSLPNLENSSLSDGAKQRIQNWLQSPISPEVKEEILSLLEKDPKRLEDAFFQNLSFGTGGMRGVMGLGTARLNLYTIQMATQGLANCLKKISQEDLSVFIGYDVRNHSYEFAKEAAKVLSGNGIRALLSKEVCPTPLVSFACRYFHCLAAIMITASHNPPEYNGYKVYGPTGGQVVPPLDQQIMEEVLKVDSPSKVILGSHFEEVGSEIDEAYLKELKTLQNLPELSKVPLQIIYTNLHGTGSRLMEKALKSWGFTHFRYVEKQKPFDPLFTYSPKPNPEEEEALQMGKEQLLKENADILIATDPDSDRIGLMSQNYRFNGHEIACLCLNHLCQTLKEKKELRENGAVIKSIVTTELFRKIAESYGVKCIDVLTGFKYIAEQINIWEAAFDGYQFLFGAEESYGYLMSSFVRDKDAISTACLIAEMAAKLKKEGKTLLNFLDEIYQKHGLYRQLLKNLAFKPGKEGMQQMSTLMMMLKENPPQQIANQKVIHLEDFSKGAQGLAPTNMLKLLLEDKTQLIIRPSGTEPKVKVYLEAIGKTKEETDAHLESVFGSFLNQTKV